MIYLDSAGSYPLLPEIRQNIASFFINDANPSASHSMGVSQMEMVDATRILIAEELGAMKNEIIFTSGATESNNVAIKAHFSQPYTRERRHMIVSSIEHKCVLQIVAYLRDNINVDVTFISPNKDGITTVDMIAEEVRHDTSLVSIMHVNNELGSINPIREIGEFCYGHDIKFHTDCAQSFMKVDIDVEDMNIDYLSISAHKIGGFKGVGAVYIRDQRTQQITPVIHGAGQEDGVRGGTLPAPLIEAFGEAIKYFPKYRDEVNDVKIIYVLQNELKEAGIPFQVNGTPNDFILSLTLPATDVSLLVSSTSDEFALASSSACSSGSIEPSHVLTGIGLDREAAEHTLRIGVHHETKYTQILKLVNAIKQF